MSEAIWSKLRGHGDVVHHGIVSLFGFRRRYVADGLQQSPMVEPVDPFERGELDGFEVAPWSPPVDHLGPFDRLRTGL